ncbi:hypothetical protein JG687_00014442 [Phytophthora cactorum]|uniref:Uncharacterized protein n=2 Tax=Phytophthora TaxID=4783 RepID=A0A329S3T3_9STRA|nr:hypothetical protein GQ600_23470 [Phytophthora cactorum]KAG6943669.1 hypothetical protein JG688_00017492 [Phytophthora aleatoria]KAG2767773.1 hypothetical protein Pcac1_g20886 [Phytophthora cactorum]KAG2817248.1 hypothetical protein PC111_g12780 [Phytophthora cactorum]KAG2826177.1 hypothetical protein PC112_g9393 [Phytophthora cactorum]
MPRPLDSSDAPSDSGSFLCERIQQFRQRMRSRCLEAHRAASAGSDDVSGLPCLLQSWRKRIETMNDAEPQHRHRSHCHRRPRTSTESDESASPPPGCPLRGPRVLHPRLERQQAVCSLSGIWSGFTSSSPPPSPEIYAKPRRRPHPYSRCCAREEDDQRKSTE